MAPPPPQQLLRSSTASHGDIIRCTRNKSNTLICTVHKLSRHISPPGHARSRSRKADREVDKVGGGKQVAQNSSNISSPISHPSVPRRSASFNGRPAAPADRLIRNIGRPKTVPELLSGVKVVADGEVMRLRESSRMPSKVLVNVTVQGSLLGPLQVLASTQWTVHQLVDAALRLYIKEGRRPPLPTVDPSAFGLHYSQFSLEALDPSEKLIGLGSRNFFVCPKALNYPTTVVAAAASSSSSSSWCSDEAGKASKIGIPWLRFIENLLL